MQNLYCRLSLKIMDLRDNLSSGLPPLPLPSSCRRCRRCICWFGIMVAVATYKCQNPASSQASSYVTQVNRTPPLVHGFGFFGAAGATHYLQRPAVIASVRACVCAHALILYIFRDRSVARCTAAGAKRYRCGVRGAFLIARMSYPNYSRSEYTHTHCTARCNNGLPVVSSRPTRNNIVMLFN